MNKLDKIIKITWAISGLTLLLACVLHSIFGNITEIQEIKYTIIIFGILMLFNENKPK